MGVTNIHHAHQVLSFAGREQAEQALIAYFCKDVLLVGRSFAQEEIDTFAGCLRSPYRDRWVEDNGQGITQPTGSDTNNLIPALYTSPGLHEERRARYLQETPKDKNGQPIELAYIIVVRGRSGALYSKIRVFYSIFVVAAGMLEEASQGFPVVFSASMLKRDIPRLTNRELAIRKAESLNTLIQAADEDEPSILLCC